MEGPDPRLVNAAMAAVSFTLTTISFRFGHDAGDQRYAALGFLALAGGYWFMMPLLGESVSYSSVVVSALTQLFALGFAFFYLNEPFSAPKILGVICSLLAIILFSLPSGRSS
ncbi:MAG: EamA family transporter [Pseudomonadota bacterium]